MTSDVNECDLKTDSCDKQKSTCSNTDGGFTCRCNSGYEQNPNDDKLCDGGFIFLLFFLKTPLSFFLKPYSGDYLRELFVRGERLLNFCCEVAKLYKLFI